MKKRKLKELIQILRPNSNLHTSSTKAELETTLESLIKHDANYGKFSAADEVVLGLIDFVTEHQSEIEAWHQEKKLKYALTLYKDTQ